MRTFASLLLSLLVFANVSPAVAASMMDEETQHQNAIQTYVLQHQILAPSSDGNMHLEMPLSRLDLVIGMVHDVYAKDMNDNCFDNISPTLPARFTVLFTDIPRSHTDAQEVCLGIFTGMIKGDNNGSFRPNDGATLAESAKMITKSYGIAPFQGLMTQPRVPWHESYWYALARRNAIPETVKNRNSVLTRGDFAEIMYRLRVDRMRIGKGVDTSLVADTLPDAPVGTGAIDSIETPAGYRLQLRAAARREQRISSQHSIYLSVNQ